MENNALSTTAWVLHDLGLAAGFGGSLFGKVALNPSVKVLDDENERSKVLHESWSNYSVLNAVGFGTAAATWVIGRTMFSGWEASKDARSLTLVKDALIATTVLTAATSIVAGQMLGRETESGQAPVITGNTPSPQAPPRVKTLQNIINATSIVNLIAAAGVIGVTAVLAMEAGKSQRWGLLSKFLP